MAERGLKSLENWAKRVTNGYPNVKVTNMSSSFRDGLAFCAIIHHYFPDLMNFDSLSKENIFHNNSLAFSTAEKKLGVPALLDAEDMVTYPVPDRLSIITYLSQLHNCFENQNRLNRVKSAVKHVLKESQSDGPPAKVPLTDFKNYTPRSHELCQVCKHRVFILERQIVAGKLYHRTCFRCSKCDTLLKPGAYVESDEKTGTYECATCPRDEKKENNTRLPTASSPEVTEKTANGIHSSGHSTPTPSPIATPKLPTLSNNINIARNNFLQKGMDSPLSESDHEESTDKSSSNESISAALDAAGDTQSQNFDSGFKEENETEHESVEKLHAPEKPVRQRDLKKTLQSPLFQIKSMKSETEANIVQKPYQSVFTRELLHSTSPLSRGLRSSMSPVSGLENESKTVFASKINSNVPFIRSTSYTTSLPRPKTSLEGNLDGTPLKSLRTSKAYSNSNLLNDSSSVYETRPRKGSLDTPLDRQDNQGMKFRSETRLLETESENTDKTLADEKSSADEEVVSPTSVKQLIQLREASIRDSVPSFSTYNRNSRPLSTINTFASNVPSYLKKENELVTENDKSNVSDGDSLDGVNIDAKDASHVTETEPIESKSNEDATMDTGSGPFAEIIEDSPCIADVKNDLPEASFNDHTCSEEEVRHPKKSDGIVNGATTKTETSKSPDIAIVVSKETEDINYPDDLNPFGDDVEDDVPKSSVKQTEYPDLLNPFGDSDEEDVVKQEKDSNYDESKNPFASDDDEEPVRTVTTPNRPPVPPPPKSITPRSRAPPYLNNAESPTGSVRGTLKKRRAPAAPHVKELFCNTSIDSETSMSSLRTSPSPLKMTPSPKVHKQRRAPPPPPSPALSNKSDSLSGDKYHKESDNRRIKQASGTPENPDNSADAFKRKKRPAPPVPIPRRREIKKIPLKDIKSEMNEIEEKQMELERQGRELENLIRDRDKDEEPSVEEEEHIMQLFELVNVKNALFRRQAELMYIKRSQRLEEEQVELEFKIRCLMIKPAHKKTDEDKVQEEELVQQLLDVVDQRNEIIDSIEKDRRREAEEDVSVQEQMDIKNGDLPIAAEIKQKSAQLKKGKKDKDKKKKKKKKAKDEVTEDAEAIGKKGTLRKKWF